MEAYKQEFIEFVGLCFSEKLLMAWKWLKCLILWDLQVVWHK